MELVGRLTANANVSNLKDDRRVVHFSIAINDRYKLKGSGEVKRLSTFVNCSYWRNSGIAVHLRKGTLVELGGRIGVRAWIDMQGEGRASLVFHVNSIKLHGNSNSGSKLSLPAKEASIEPMEGLPF